MIPKKIKIVFDIVPVAKGRPKFRVRGKFASVYTPAKTAKYEKKIKQIAFDYIAENSLDGFESRPLKGEIIFYLPIPKSTSKKFRLQMESGSIRPNKKPDLDNLTKAVLDAINKVVISDDSDIVDLHEQKFYDDGKGPRVELTLEVL